MKIEKFNYQNFVEFLEYKLSLSYSKKIEMAKI